MLTLNTYIWYTVKRKQLFEWKQSNKIWERIFSVHLKYHASFIHLFICIVNGMLHLIKREREHENERQWKNKKTKQNKHVIDFVEIFVFQTCSLAYRIPILYFVSQLWKPSFKSILGDIFCSEANRNRNNNKIRKEKYINIFTRFEIHNKSHDLSLIVLLIIDHSERCTSTMLKLFIWNKR